MKKNISIICIFLLSHISYSQSKNTECSFNPFTVTLKDTSGSDSNIRDKPNGEIILKLNNEIDYYALNIVDYNNGWLKVTNIQSFEFDYIITDLNAWIHQSIITVYARKDITLVSKPNGSTTVAILKVKEDIEVNIKDICSNWMKIEYNGSIGWVASNTLCGNPVTTCP